MPELQIVRNQYPQSAQTIYGKEPYHRKRMEECHFIFSALFAFILFTNAVWYG